jgi:putative adhesin
MNQTFETPGPLRLAIEIPSGEVDLEASPGTRTVVDVDGPEEVRVELRQLPGEGHELVVEAPRRKGLGLSLGRGEYRVRIACPEDTTVRARTKSADVHGRGRFGEIDVASASGDVTFEQVDGEAQVKTASGDVELGRVSDGAGVHSASGDVTITSVAGPLVANTVSGDILVRDAQAGVRATSVSGDQRLEAVQQGAVQTQAVSGDVTIGVRRGARVYLDCNTLSGTTTSELDVSGEPVGEEGPLVEIRAKTVSGDIRIVRAAAVTEEVTS